VTIVVCAVELDKGRGEGRSVNARDGQGEICGMESVPASVWIGSGVEVTIVPVRRMRFGVGEVLPAEQADRKAIHAGMIKRMTIHRVE